MSVLERVAGPRRFLGECAAELGKVAWPDADQLRSATIVVVAFTVVISLIIWIMDRVSDWFVQLIMGMFGA
ncbi:MAG: preprotein translocase subunit SecE [Gemmatimonadetes bacterium]|nr:preprotein translocase subunit SecE [Gemmatimonadota bacterium]